ncbi:mechanosensitive ion channel protein 6-like [Aristolochia californica]|uniref:mechanosensitive ion channel protein 6-like n=1 Tax=Aristolochia californica TaxID=171875 RepID=UPI0035DC15FB
MDSLRKSFKHHSSPTRDGGPEALPMLSEHDNVPGNIANSAEIVVKIDGDDRSMEQSAEAKAVDNRVWRGSSYEFWNNEAEKANVGPGSESEFNFQRPPSDDPPSKLIGQFLHKQQASGEMILDMDLEMEELRPGRNLPPIRESPKQNSKDLRVSFQPPRSRRSEISPQATMRRRTHGSNTTSSSEEEMEDKGNARKSASSGQVLKCSSNLSFHQTSSLLRSKTKSRLLDPPQQNEERKSGKLKSGQLKSKILSRQRDEEEDDPFLEEDLPDEFKKGKMDCATVFQWLSLVVILAGLACSLTIPLLERQTVWGLHLWKWEVLVLVLICGRLVSGWCIRLVVFFIERNFLLRKRVLYFVYGIRKAVQNCLWLGLVLIAWHLLFDKKVERETEGKVLPYVSKILLCLVVGTLIWLVKTLLVKVLASSFHVSTYFDRIQEALFNQYVIQTLSGPPLVEIQNAKDEEEKVMAEVQNLQNAGATVPADLRAAAFIKSPKVAGSGLQRSPISPMSGKSIRLSDGVSKNQEEGITIDHLHRLNQKNISAWNMKRLMKIVRHGVLSTLDERLGAIDQVDEDESALQIRSEHEAKRAAKKIFNNVAKAGAKCICLEDLMRFMGEDEATKTMGLFEGVNETKRVSKTALKNWVIGAFRERRALSLTLNDTKTAVNKLHQMVNIVVGIIIVVIWLLILGIATTHLLVFISSQLLLVVFIFGNTCKTIFEAIIFLFVMHPFDVGDRCEIDAVQMVVEEMNILTTIFLRYDNQKITYPNSVLSTKPISNYYRSPDMGDAIDFSIHVATPVERVAVMKDRIKRYIESKNEHWYPDPMVMIREVEEMNKLKLSVWLQHRMNYQNMGERWIRREYVVQEMIKIFRELDIEYRMLPLEVNVRNMPPLSSNRLPSTWTT